MINLEIHVLPLSPRMNKLQRVFGDSVNEPVHEISIDISIDIFNHLNGLNIKYKIILGV